MNGDEIRRAREERGLTQQQLATEIEVGLRTIGNWERGEAIPKNRMGMLERFFADDDKAQTSNPLRGASDIALLSELLRRAVDRSDSAAAG